MPAGFVFMIYAVLRKPKMLSCRGVNFQTRITQMTQIGILEIRVICVICV